MASSEQERAEALNLANWLIGGMAKSDEESTLARALITSEEGLREAERRIVSQRSELADLNRDHHRGNEFWRKAAEDAQARLQAYEEALRETMSELLTEAGRRNTNTDVDRAVAEALKSQQREDGC